MQLRTEIWDAIPIQERKVAAMLLAGLQAKQIAQALDKNLNTTKAQIHTLYKRLGLGEIGLAGLFHALYFLPVVGVDEAGTVAVLPPRVPVMPAPKREIRRRWLKAQRDARRNEVALVPPLANKGVTRQPYVKCR